MASLQISVHTSDSPCLYYTRHHNTTCAKCWGKHQDMNKGATHSTAVAAMVSGVALLHYHFTAFSCLAGMSRRSFFKPARLQ